MLKEPRHENHPTLQKLHQIAFNLELSVNDSPYPQDLEEQDPPHVEEELEPSILAQLDAEAQRFCLGTARITAQLQRASQSRGVVVQNTQRLPDAQLRGAPDAPFLFA